MKIHLPPENAVPFGRQRKDRRQAAMRAVMEHIRHLLRRGPHGVLELRPGLDPYEAGALPEALAMLANAGEIAAMGHGVYMAVPWMPAMRPVVPDTDRDLVLSAAALLDPPTAEHIASWLGMSPKRAESALHGLEASGDLLFNESSQHYNFLSPQLRAQIRKGARDRVFADVGAAADTPEA